MTAASNEVVAGELRELIAKATDEDLADGGRYFSQSCDDLTQCRHDEIGEYQRSADGDLIEWLWNRRKEIVSLYEARAHSDPRPVAGEVREAIIAAITEADGRFGYSYRLTKMDETGEEHTLFMDGFEPAVFEDRADGYPVLEQRRNTLRTDAILAALATHSPAPMAGKAERLCADAREFVEAAAVDGFDPNDALDLLREMAAAHPSTQEG